MWPAIKVARVLELSSIDAFGNLTPGISRCGVRADSAKKISDCFRISDSAKKCLYSRAGNRWKEILQVHSQDNSLSDVGSRKCLDGSSFAKTMDRWMQWDFVQNQVEDLLLQFL